MEGVIPPVRENLPGISNPKAVFEVSGAKKSSLDWDGVPEAVARSQQASPRGGEASKRHPNGGERRQADVTFQLTAARKSPLSLTLLPEGHSSTACT
jgi:hypothetical protein